LSLFGSANSLQIIHNNKHRAFLKWAGGKYGLMEDIRAKLPDANKLVEPFVGAGSVFLNTDYPRYLLNDINPDLINLYKIIQTRYEDYIKDAEALFCAENNHSERYYTLRTEFNLSIDLYQRAVIFLYLNRHGYNGLCRYNLSGGYNVPFGRYKKPYFPKQELYFFAEKAQRATFTCEPFLKSFSRARKGNVIYCDPPYAPIGDNAYFTQYASNGFSLLEQDMLAQAATQAAANRGISVLISNHDTALTRQLYNRAILTELQVSRTISQNAGNREKVGELLALFQSNTFVTE
jgi:DNA adenine methylase